MGEASPGFRVVAVAKYHFPRTVFGPRSRRAEIFRVGPLLCPSAAPLQNHHFVFTRRRLLTSAEDLDRLIRHPSSVDYSSRPVFTLDILPVSLSVASLALLLQPSYHCVPNPTRGPSLDIRHWQSRRQ